MMQLLRFAQLHICIIWTCAGGGHCPARCEAAIGRSPAADLRGQVLQHRGGDGGSVVGRGAPPQLVQRHQAGRRRRLQRWLLVSVTCRNPSTQGCKWSSIPPPQECCEPAVRRHSRRVDCGSCNGRRDPLLQTWRTQPAAGVFGIAVKVAIVSAWPRCHDCHSNSTATEQRSARKPSKTLPAAWRRSRTAPRRRSTRQP